MKAVRQFFLFCLGIALLLIGVAGLVLPIVPGWLFIFAGLSFIAPRLAASLRWKLFEKRFKKDVVHFQEWLPKVEAGYTTRNFPFYLAKAEDLLGGKNQKEFLRNFSASRPVPKNPLQPLEKIVLLKQVHGDSIAVLEDASAFDKPGFYPQESSDAVITSVPGLTLLVFSADCLTLFYSAGEWVGLAHAGWRGTKSGVAAKCLTLLSQRSGVPVSAVRVIFGPRIGPAAYEVGPEFSGHFKERSLKRTGGKLYFDLSLENRHQLLEAGAEAANLTDHGVCTVARNSEFYSFRMEGKKAGRIISFVTRL